MATEIWEGYARPPSPNPRRSRPRRSAIPALPFAWPARAEEFKERVARARNGCGKSNLIHGGGISNCWDGIGLVVQSAKIGRAIRARSTPDGGWANYRLSSEPARVGVVCVAVAGLRCGRAYHQKSGGFSDGIKEGAVHVQRRAFRSPHIDSDHLRARRVDVRGCPVGRVDWPTRFSSEELASLP